MGKKASKFGSSSMSHFQVPSSWVSRTASRTLSLLTGIHTPWHSFCRAIFKALRLFGQKGILQGHRWMHQCEIKKLHSKNWQPLVIHVNRNSDRTLPDCFHECNGCYFFAATSMRFMTGPQKKNTSVFQRPEDLLGSVALGGSHSNPQQKAAECNQVHGSNLPQEFTAMSGLPVNGILGKLDG